MDLVRRLREQRGWSQEQLAKVAEISKRTIQRIESGEVARPACRRFHSTFGIESASPGDRSEGPAASAIRRRASGATGRHAVSILRRTRKRSRGSMPIGRRSRGSVQSRKCFTMRRWPP